LAESSTQSLQAEADRHAEDTPERAAKPVRTHPNPVPRSWWRQRSYRGYVLREATSVPIAAWFIWFLVEVARLKVDGRNYRPLNGPVFAIFGLICLGFALWHTYSTLTLAGMITRIPRGSGELPGRYIVGALVGAFVVISVVIAFLLIRAGQ
jgi:fumarate reductase subunit C